MAVRDRWLLALLAFDAVLLAVVELLFLFSYLTLPGIGQIQFPVTAVLAGVTNPLLVFAAGRIGGSARAAIVPLAVWFLTMVVFGLLGPGGDMLLPQDWRSLLLLVGGALPGAMALGMTMARIAAENGASTRG